MMVLRTKALPNIGQEVLGLDLDKPIDDIIAQELRQLWSDAGIVLFRGIGNSPERLLTLSRVFGTLEPHPIQELRLPSHPDLILLTNKGGMRGPVYAFDGVPTYGRIPWHTDLAFSTLPNAGALLNMVEKASQGGHTAWLDTAAAYDELDESLKQRLVGVEARFEFCADLSGMRFGNPNGVRIGEAKSSFPDFPAIARPILWQHPSTGRTILNICPLNIRSIIGMGASAGDALIEELIAAVIQPHVIYDHAWDEGDIMLWDNYRMMHSAEGHPVDVPRVAHRTTLRGSTTVGRTLNAAEGKAA